MRLLLDTNALLWWLFGLPRLGPAARAATATAPAASVHVSSVSAVEISIKQALGRLEAPEDRLGQVTANGFTELPLRIRRGLAAAELPRHHTDPFDRMLIAQAVSKVSPWSRPTER